MKTLINSLLPSMGSARNIALGGVMCEPITAKFCA
jgi:hypothetical protein